MLAELQARKKQLAKVKTKVTDVTGNIHYEEKANGGRFLEIVTHEPPTQNRSGGGSGFFVEDTSPDEQLHEVVPGLYIGSQDAAANLGELRRLNVRYIVNAAQGIPNIFADELMDGDGDGERHRRFEYLNVPLLDLDDHSQGAVASPYFQSSSEWIHTRINEQHKGVLVHCNAGISRSSTIVIAYLIRYHHMNIQTALATLKQSRPQCQPNRGFMSQLQAYEQQFHPS